MDDVNDRPESGRLDGYELDELLGAYALDAVDPDEARRVEDYLEINPRAAQEVADHREVATMLAFTGMEAPDDLWDRIARELDEPEPAPRPTGELSAILGQAGQGVQRGQAGDVAPPTGAAPMVPPPPDTNVASIDSARSRRRLSSFAPWLAAGAAAVVIAVVAISVAVIDRADAPTDPLAAAVDEARADRDSVITTLQAEGSDATAEAIIDQDGHGYLLARDLPPLADDQTYQLWGVVSDGQVISLGILGPNPEIEPFTVEGEVAAVAVTIEEAPGVVADGNPDGAFVGTF